MGWCSMPMHDKVSDWFRNEWKENTNYEVLDVTLVKRNTIYAAIKELKTGDVFCAVYMVSWSRDVYNFSYKSMTEHCGPNQIECPERIFKLLTPLNDDNDSMGYARRWRENVEEFHTQRKAIKKMGNFIFKVSSPIQFTSGRTFEYFKKVGKAIYALNKVNDNYNVIYKVRIGKLTNYNFELIKKVAN